MRNKTLFTLFMLASLGILSQPAQSRTPISSRDFHEALKIAETEGQVRVMLTLHTRQSLLDALGSGNPANTPSPAQQASNFLQ